MEFFRPWGQDFVVLRSVNKRIKAAYHDHLNNIINIDKFMARNSLAAQTEARAGVKKLIDGFCTEPLAPPLRKIYMDDQVERMVVVLIHYPLHAFIDKLESMDIAFHKISDSDTGAMTIYKCSKDERRY